MLDFLGAVGDLGVQKPGNGGVGCSQNSSGRILKVLCVSFPLQAQETLSFSCWNPGFSQPEEFSAAAAPQELLCALSQRFLGKLGNGSMGDPKEVLHGSVLSHRFRELLKVPLEFQTELGPYRQNHPAFPWEIFPDFFSPQSIFSGHSLSFGRLNRCYSELQSSTLRVFFFGHSRFYWNQEKLGNADFSSGENELGIFEVSLICQNIPGSPKIPGAMGIPIPPALGCEGSCGMFSMWEWGESKKGFPHR